MAIRLLLICQARAHKNARLKELDAYSKSVKAALLNQFNKGPSKPKLTVMEI